MEILWKGRKLCGKAQFRYQEIRCNDNIFRSGIARKLFFPTVLCCIKFILEYRDISTHLVVGFLLEGEYLGRRLTLSSFWKNQKNEKQMQEKFCLLNSYMHEGWFQIA